MTPKQFARYLARDKGCLHCGATEALAPNHRANRGMGGSRERDVPSNIVVICSTLNGLIESDDRWARVAKEYGWKLNSWDDPLTEPVFDFQTRRWYLLNDDFLRIVVDQKGNYEL